MSLLLEALAERLEAARGDSACELTEIAELAIAEGRRLADVAEHQGRSLVGFAREVEGLRRRVAELVGERERAGCPPLGGEPTLFEGDA